MQKQSAKLFKVLLVLALLVSTADCSKKKADLGLAKTWKQKNVMISMSDATELATDIYYPAGVDKAPVILVRTPYGKSLQVVMGKRNFSTYYAQNGYIVIIQDVRGTGKSDGVFYPFIHDGKDGKETIAWIEDQPWFNGKLGTFGPSYLGTTQWFASPGQDIDAMYLSVTSPNLKEVIFRGGQLNLLTIYTWSVMMGRPKLNIFSMISAMSKINKFQDYVFTLPLDQADDKAGYDVAYFNDATDINAIYDLYEEVRFDDLYAQVTAPALTVAGWYDIFLGPQLGDFNKMTDLGRDWYIMVGPWAHGISSDSPVDYGPEASKNNILGSEMGLKWFDYKVKGISGEAADWPRVQLFVMGDNVWRDEKEWPLARTVYTKYYLHSNGNANTRAGDGTLSTRPPQSAEPTDKYTYDPMDPVPTKGGANLVLNLGAQDQAEIEDRSDVLVYTTGALENDLEVTGPITASLCAASDAKDTDFTVKLVDVYPDGRAINIQDGIVRAMYRDNDPLNPTPLVPGEVDRYEIDLWATSNVFKAGHKIRVEVSSSNFPRFNRNLNTGGPVKGETEHEVARQTIYHDPDHPSYIILPIIPR